jgi:hypothetical protein
MGKVVPVLFYFPRWGSAYLMVDRLLKIKDEIIELSEIGNRNV